MDTFVKKTSIKLNILQRIRKFLTEIQAKSLVSSFVNHQFDVFSIIGHTLIQNNFLVNGYIIIRVKLRFIIFTWIGLVIIL